jgi:uncharacterized membrane protein
LRIEPHIDISDRDADAIRDCFSLHKFRSIHQDIEYGIRQLVDIGIKAISPAVNDPTTCVNCINYLGVIIKELAARGQRSIKYLELESQRIVLKEPSFEQYVDDAFDQIYHYGRKDHVIVKTIINTLAEVIAAVPDPERAQVIVREVAEMELTSLYQQSQHLLFPSVENRNYVRKALIKFYAVAEAQFAAFGLVDAAAEHAHTGRIIENSIGA